MSIPTDVITIAKVCADPCSYAAREELYRQAMLVMQCSLVTGGVGAANVAAGTVAIPTTAGGTLLVAARDTRTRVTVYNTTTTPAYVGTGVVSSTNGAYLPGVVGASLTFYTTAALKALSTSGTINLSYVEEYN